LGVAPRRRDIQAWRQGSPRALDESVRERRLTRERIIASLLLCPGEGSRGKAGVGE